jgi:glyoxylase-like metal-dependent hydrolase (beta-lactamase superfamily II)
MELAAGATDDVDDGEKPEEDDTGYFNFTRTRQTPWGGTTWPVNRRQRITRILATRNLVPSQRPPIPTKRVSHGDHLTLAGREWVAIHTPGHTGDHLCLYDPTEQLLISGDHVLPTITPHVGGISPLRDPLGSFIASLALLRDIGPVKTVLPAHGYPIADMRTRIDQIVQHHDDRLVQLREIGADLGDKGGTVVEISQRLFKQPLWGMMSESETYAHLEFLRLRGDAERFRVGDQLGYRVDPGGTSSTAAAAVSLVEAEAAGRSPSDGGDSSGSPDLDTD